MKCEGGIADIVTPTELIEIKKWSDWQKGIGQLQTYETHIPDRKLVLCLYGQVKRKKVVMATTQRKGITLIQYEVLIASLLDIFAMREIELLTKPATISAVRIQLYTAALQYVNRLLTEKELTIPQLKRLQTQFPAQPLNATPTTPPRTC